MSISGPKVYHGFLAILVRNKAPILAISDSNKVWFLHSSLEFGVLFGRSYFFVIIDNTMNKSPSQCL